MIKIYGHKNPDTDSILSSIVMENLEKKLGNMEVKACMLGEPNKETKYALNFFGVKEPELITKLEEGEQVILVDHNQFGQSAEGIENAKILKVVDHHEVIDFKTTSPVFYLAMPVGCTATILYKLYKIYNVEIDKTIAGLMLSAIISDTLLFKSPTTTKDDIEVGKELEKIAEINMNEYGYNMLKAGTDLSDYSAEELIRLDSKTLTRENGKYQVAQVNTVNIDDVMKNKEELEKAMERFISENGVEFFVFMITDIMEKNTKAIVIGNRLDVVEKAFEKTIENNTLFLPGVVSRKKQVTPFLDKFF